MSTIPTTAEALQSAKDCREIAANLLEKGWVDAAAAARRAADRLELLAPAEPHALVTLGLTCKGPRHKYGTGCSYCDAPVRIEEHPDPTLFTD